MRALNGNAPVGTPAPVACDHSWKRPWRTSLQKLACTACASGTSFCTLFTTAGGVARSRYGEACATTSTGV